MTPLPLTVCDNKQEVPELTKLLQLDIIVMQTQHSVTFGLVSCSGGTGSGVICFVYSKVKCVAMSVQTVSNADLDGSVTLLQTPQHF